MLTLSKKAALVMVCAGTLILARSLALAVDTAPDPVGTAWKARTETAAKKLAVPGLDKCDKGVELSFKQPNEVTSGTKRSFELMIEIDRQAMVASYSYEGQRLTSFVLLYLPPGWLAVQKIDSKSLSVLVPDSNCSFDLCTDDPFSAGPCPEQRKFQENR